MSEESNIAVPAAKKDNLENGIKRSINNPKTPLHANDSQFTENSEVLAEQVRVQENRQSIELVESEKQNRLVLGCLEVNVETEDSSSTEQELNKPDASVKTRSEKTSDIGDSAVKSVTSDTSTETKYLERASDLGKPAVKYITTDASTQTRSLEETSDVGEPIAPDSFTESKSLERKSDVGEPAVKSVTSDASTESKSLERKSDNESAVNSVTSDASTENKSLERKSDNESAVNSVTSDASTENKSLEKKSDVGEPSVKSITSDASIDSRSLEKTTDIGEPTMKSTTFDVSTETKTSERAVDIDQPAAKSTASSEISPSRVLSSDKGLEEVTENIQLIYEGLKDMKISAKEITVAALGKGRKPPTTPRARSTPVKPLTSPPLTRSRSRDLRKFPSTPSSPRSSASRKTSENDSDEVRGRQRTKRN